MVANAYFLAGKAGNACAAAVVTPTVSPAEDALYPASNLITGHPWEIFRYGSAPTNPHIRFDMNQVGNGSFEEDANGEAPTGWVQAAGTPTVSSAQADPGDGGSVSLALDDSEIAHKDIELVAGNRYRIEVALRGNGSGTAAVRLIHLDSQRYKTTASETSYSTSVTNLGTRSTASWADVVQNFVVPTQATGMSDRADVRVQVLKTDAGGADVWVDNIRVFPDIDFASLHFLKHFGTNSAWNVVSSDNNWSSQTTEDQLPANGFRSFVKFVPSDSDPRQYWGFESTGTFFRVPSFGQFAMGEAVQLTRNPHRPELGELWPQSAREGLLQVPANLSEAPATSIPLSFRTTTAGRDQLKERLVGGSRGGAEQAVIVPDDSKSAEVFLGRLAGEVTYREVATGVFEATVPFVETPFPILAAG